MDQKVSSKSSEISSGKGDLKLDQEFIFDLRQQASSLDALRVEVKLNDMQPEIPKFQVTTDPTLWINSLFGPQSKSISNSINVGIEKCYDYLHERATNLESRISPYIAVPFDESRFFRLGDEGHQIGMGMPRDKLEKLASNLKDQGFPSIIPEELQLVQLLRTVSLKVVHPELKLIGQHFPAGSGGKSEIEATEEEPVKLSAVNHRGLALMAPWLSGIMLGHATCDIHERDFPGIGKIIAETPLHPALQNIPLDSIPPSLNPIWTNYLRQKLGKDVFIMPDWYDMQAVNKFVTKLPATDFGFKNGEVLEPAIKTLLLAAEAEVDMLPGLTPASFSKLNVIKSNPEVSNKFETQIDGMFHRAWKSVVGSEPDPHKISEDFDLKEKLSCLMLSSKFPSSPKDYFSSGSVAPRYIDIWNRTGVMVLALRQKVVEHATGQRFAPLPESDKQEQTWFNELMSDSSFRSTYDTINWNSEGIRTLYREAAENLIKQKPASYFQKSDF